MVAKAVFLAILPLLPFSKPFISSPSQAGKDLKGFKAERIEYQKELESKFLAIPSPESCKKFLRILTEDPHMAGTPASRKTAEYIRSRLLEYGFEAELVKYVVFLPYPKSIEVTMVAPEEYSAQLKEVGWDWDKDSASPDAVLPFNTYSPSGDVTADLVYANYGLPSDFDKLAELGVEVREKIVIVRYGACFPETKTRAAEERGAAGVLIYSDPADDGYAKGDIYPRGPWRPESSIQRATLSCLSQFPGDPLSPGWPAITGARRIEASQSDCLPKIPTTPISYGDATPLLKNISGPNVPKGWQGHLPFAYHVGPGPARVRLKLEMEFQDRPIWNVIAKLPGVEIPNQWVILGNHHDAWVHGAVDPGSGTSVMLEIARALGELKKRGWRPRRTIFLASWDAEEFGFIGSTELVEENADLLSSNAVAYLNLGSAVSGSGFRASGVPGLANFIRDLTRGIEDPRSRKTIHDLWRQQSGENEKPLVGDLGGGYGFTAFLTRLGIPCLDLSFQGPYGVSHSMLDDFYWMSNFGDPTFEYHATLAKIVGLGLLRISQCDLLPLDPAGTASSIARHLESIEKNTKEAPASFAVAKNAAAKMKLAGESLITRALEALTNQSAAEIAAINARFLEVETSFVDQEGLRGRPWYRNLLFAPDPISGFSPSTLPGIREAVESNDSERIQYEISRLVEKLDEAVRIMSPANLASSPTPGGESEGKAR